MKFYPLLAGSIFFIILGSKIVSNNDVLEQTANVATLALSVILQALPFILIGVFTSSLIRYLVKDDWIAKFAPKNAVGGVITGSLLGLFIPVCDCGVLPVARGLFRKGVSMHTALAYLLTAPVINPVVIIATAMAFQWNWHIVSLRVFNTIIVGATTALLAGSLFSSRAFTNAEWHQHQYEHENSKVSLHQLLIHAGDEFFDVGRYLIISAFLAAAIQIWVPKGILLQATSNPFMAAGAMMVLAIAMSLCSDADAFVARVLANQFPLGSVMAFLVIGQIIDLRNIILFTKNFRLSLFLFLAATSIGLTYVLSLSIDFGLWKHLF
ncbi:permease [Desulfosporosinus sp. OT]|uniref:permease n=1 Tax=Desulfosporosinus sp. OT TaxID=913865 RepID=UPI0002239EF4|nr:permease [Desulfosporosinus sp. OT]EGW36625.1 permease family protein [Desulfosporosinus sp. OT]